MEIPLFPLPNLVLFPQVAVPLHIFEDRYKLMISRCIDQADVFGLVLLREGAEQEDEENIVRVGVTARVVQADRLEDGRLNILAAGEGRFRIVEFTGQSPYWTADVEFFEDDPHDEDADLQEAYEKVGRLYRQVADLTAQLKETESPQLELPDTPLGLSYMVSYVLDLNETRKQELLEITSTLLRLDTLATDLETLIAQLENISRRKEINRKVVRNGDLGKPGDSKTH